MAPNDSRMPGYDPLLDGMRRRLRDTQQEWFRLIARNPGSFRRLFVRTLLHFSYRWLDILLTVVPVAFFATSLFVFSSSYPWSSRNTDRYGDVVIACASVVALGSIILTAVTTAFARAAEFGPGFTASLLRRPWPWLLGLMIAPLTTFLFWLGTQHPDREAALAASLLAGGAFAAFWTASRSLVGAADSLSITRRETKRLREDMFRAIKSGERFVKAVVPRRMRDPVPIQATVTEERVDMGTEFVRHLSSGARRCFAKGQTDEGLIFLNGMLDCFSEFAKRYDGAVGNENQLVGVVLKAVEEFALAASSNSDDFIATQCVISLSRILVLPYEHPDSAKARYLARSYLVRSIEQKWNDEQSRLPASAVSTFSNSLPPLVSMGARQDAEETLEVLVKIATKARQTRKAHIELVAVEGITKNFRTFALTSDGKLRTHYLSVWTDAATRLTSLRSIPDSMMMFSPLDQLVPGIAIMGGTGLQHVIVDLVSEVPQIYADVVVAICKWLERSFPELVQNDKRAGLTGGGAREGLSVLLCVALLGVRFARNEPLKLAERMATTATEWLYKAPQREDLLLDAEFVEVLWSILLTCGCIADDPSLLTEHSKYLIYQMTIQGPIFDTYTLRFIAGLYLAAGNTAEEVDQLTEFLAEDDEYGLRSFSGLHIAPLGRAPSCNRNSTEHYADAPDVVNQWALERFPSFGSSQGVASEAS